MGIFSGFGNNDEAGYAARLRQWVQDQEDQRKLTEVNALRQNLGPLLDERLNQTADPYARAGLQAQRAVLESAGPNSLADVTRMLQTQLAGDVQSAVRTPDMREYDVARGEGYTGGIQQWLAQQHDPAATKQYEYMMALPPEQREAYMRVMKAQTPEIISANTRAEEGAKADVQLKTSGPIETAKAEGKALPEKLSAVPAAIEGHLGVLDTADLVDNAIAEIESIIQANPTAVGLGAQWLQKLPATDATRVANLLDTVQANEVQAAMNKARASSPTGATGYGALSEREGEMMKRMRVALSQRDDPQSVLASLAQLRELNAKARERARAAWQKDYDWNERYKAAAPSAYREVMPPPELKPTGGQPKAPAPAAGWKVVR